MPRPRRPDRGEYKPESTHGRVVEAVRVNLLGSFRVSVGSRVVEESAWQLRKAASLVKLLSLVPAHRLHREQVMDLLWPNSRRRAAANSLRQALHVARRALEPDPSAPRYLVSHGEHLTLCPSGSLWIDVEAFEEAAATARHSREPRAYRAAIVLYAGELLPGDPYEEWAEDRRRELRGLHLALLNELAEVYEDHGEFEAAAGALREVLAEEPTRQEAHAALMRHDALSGQRQSALAQYERLRQDLRRELGAEPDAKTSRLHKEILAGTFQPARPRPHLDRDSEPIDAARHNLPAAQTSFVGRVREMREVERALAMTQLLTLTGAGGSGKTRLALEVARDLVGAYADGVSLVELAGLSEPDLVPQSVASALEVREQPGRPLLDTLLDAMRDKEILLILDNCEHLIDTVARLADVLLDSSPRVRVLATSREPLGTASELSWLVPSLSTPGAQQSPAVEVLESYESVRLFAERASLRHPDFELTPENATNVAQLCARLEGVPLAIELAAARVGVLSAQQISERLGHSLKLLAGSDRTMDPRHQTLRATLDWSYELLGESERVLFGRLSAFAGGFALDAAEIVGSGSVVGEEDVLDLLGSLRDKSLVVTKESWEWGAHYRLLEPVRQYAQERLWKSGEAEAVSHRHAAFFLALAERAEPKLKGPGQVEWLERLEEDNGNLRAAMALLLGEGEIEDAVRLGWALWIFWLIHGHQSEGRRWIETALAKGENLTAHARAKALWVQASTYYGLANPERLERICDEAAALFRQVGDNPNLAYPLALKASVMMQRGDAERAIELYEEAIELGRDVDDKWGRSGGLAHMGTIYLGLDDYDQAAHHFEEALALSREIGNRLSESAALYGLAQAQQGRGDHDRAAELYAEGLKSSAEAGDKANIAYCLEGLAQVAAAQGEIQRAARLFGAAEASLEAVAGAVYPYAQDRSLHEQAVEEVHSRLDEATFLAAWAEGGAMTLSEAVEYALSGGKEPAPPASPTVMEEHPVTLTRREQEVAILVARGLTSRQISEELHLSERTITTHVSRILKKLKVRSRDQIAARMGDERTLGDS